MAASPDDVRKCMYSYISFFQQKFTTKKTLAAYCNSSTPLCICLNENFTFTKSWVRLLEKSPKLRNENFTFTKSWVRLLEKVQS